MQKRSWLTLPAVCVAAFLMALNYKTFVTTGGLYPGGVAGLTILIIRLVDMALHISLPFTVVNVLLNTIPVYIGFRYIGKKFTIFSCVMIILNSVLSDLIPTYIITEDILLISVFGGIMQGLAIGICLNAGATSGGTDFISIFLSERRGIDSFNIILAANAVILGMAGFIFGWDKALYSIIFQCASTAVIRMMYKKFRQCTLFIVTDKPDEICETIYRSSMHGATILEGVGSYEHEKRRLVYSVISAAESKKVTKAVRDTDPHAFINEVETQKLLGNCHRPKED
ncbi:MAG: YitT family protein [Oscillospiraceae bacterium]|nr:YitT family protein [Oscillospiraceae bacterium]